MNEKVYKYASGLELLPDQIILYGYSMGAAMMSQLAAAKPAKAMIMKNGYLPVNVPYALNENGLELIYFATTDEPTVANLTKPCFF